MSGVLDVVGLLGVVVAIEASGSMIMLVVGHVEQLRVVNQGLRDVVGCSIRNVGYLFCVCKRCQYGLVCLCAFIWCW